jgi:UDP-3-O-[3-hydroxymyristoyl] N-acetylglucosamine deacetylase/3-hydroxyacyl-[acyl-carrier-protein] dehydratase
MGLMQRTIKKEAKLSGIGLHSGKNVNMCFVPAEVNSGIKFKRTDIDGQPIIDADVAYVTDISRGTTLESKGNKVMTVEHTLAALTGLGIDNVVVELDGPEMPILDGSSKPFIEALSAVGIEEQNSEKEYFEIKDIITYSEPERGVELIALPSDSFRVSVMIDYNSKVIGTQYATLDNIDNFKDEIAPSRTFCFLHELEQLVEHNLIKGGDLSNAVVFVDRVIKEGELDHLADLLNKPKVSVKDEGYLNNVDLMASNEPARHKLLDVIGDLTLTGMPIKGHIIATRPGHKANVEFAKLIKEEIKQYRKKKEVPVYDSSKEPIFDINAISNILPHKYPFLLVDKIVELSEDSVLGIKNVTRNEEFFNGHFPGNPVMPGVLQVEAMAQTGGIMILQTVDDPHMYDTYFVKIDKTRFKQKVLPGDTLKIKMQLTRPIKRGLVEMEGAIYVGDNVVTEAHLLAQIVRKPE